jgi:predicted transcriptional regulator
MDDDCRKAGGHAMPRELPSLGELEIQVLHQVWRLQPCTERQITERLQEGRTVGRTTVLKTVQRLEAKGLLSRVPGDGPVRFAAAVPEERVLPALIGRFVNQVLGGSTESLVAYLADTEELSATDLIKLRAIARKIADSKPRPRP